MTNPEVNFKVSFSYDGIQPSSTDSTTKISLEFIHTSHVHCLQLMWHNIISPLNHCHRFHNSYTNTHRYLSSVSVNTKNNSPSAHCCSRRMNSTCDLAYEAHEALCPHISPRYLCTYSSPLYAVISVCTGLPSVFDYVWPHTDSGSFPHWEHSLLSLAHQRWLPDP